MANLIADVEKDVKLAAGDVLHWLRGAGRAVEAAPAVVAALAVVAEALEAPLTDAAAVAANPLNIALDIRTAEDLRAAWPAVKSFLTELGVRF
jgi:hypothetical protein